MPRFFISKEEIDGDYVAVRGADAHHIASVLRKKPGDALTVADFFGQEYTCEIKEASDAEVLLRILSARACQSEPRCPVVLCMALPKGDKMETVIQKAVELGATEILPFSSARTIVRLDAQAAAKKVERWQKIAKSAAEQCGRGIIPAVRLPLSLARMLEEFKEEDVLRLICDEAEDGVRLKDALRAVPAPRKIVFIVGAEGGFERAEVAQARDAGFLPVSLGRRILRCETAPLCVLAQCAYEYDL